MMPIFKLGKRLAKWDRRRLRTASYFLPDLAPPPDSCDYYGGRTNWGMMCNDVRGCCTIAAKFHQLQIWIAQATGKQVDFSDADILKYYALFDEWNPADPDNTDNGGIIADVLDDWRKADILGHNLTAYSDPQPQNKTHIMQAINLFGGIDLGFQLPMSAQGKETWEVVSGDDGGVWGGHNVNAGKYYKSDGPVVISWGRLIPVTWGFWDKYCDEAHALLSPEWPIPPGLDTAAMLADLKAVASHVSG